MKGETRRGIRMGKRRTVAVPAGYVRDFVALEHLFARYEIF